MLLHIVLFNFKEDISAEKINAVFAESEKLADIPGVSGFRIGRRAKPAGQFEYAIHMNFDSLDALEAYRGHPAHIHFRDTVFVPFLAGKLSLDYEDL